MIKTLPNISARKMWFTQLLILNYLAAYLEPRGVQYSVFWRFFAFFLLLPSCLPEKLNSKKNTKTNCAHLSAPNMSLPGRIFFACYEYVYWLRHGYFVWAGELVCGFRTQKLGSEETPPTCRIAVPQGTGREPWQRSRNETSNWTGNETFVMSSAPAWKR